MTKGTTMPITTDHAKAAAIWLVTFLEGGGQIIDESGRRGVFWPLGPTMPHSDWLREEWTGEVFTIVNAVVAEGCGGDEARAAVAERVRGICCGEDATHH